MRRIFRTTITRGFVSRSWSEGVDCSLYLMDDAGLRATWKYAACAVAWRTQSDVSNSWRHRVEYSTTQAFGQPYSTYDFGEPKAAVVMPPSDFQEGPYLVTDEGLDPIEYVNADDL